MNDIQPKENEKQVISPSEFEAQLDEQNAMIDFQKLLKRWNVLVDPVLTLSMLSPPQGGIRFISKKRPGMSKMVINNA